MRLGLHPVLRQQALKPGILLGFGLATPIMHRQRRACRGSHHLQWLLTIEPEKGGAQDGMARGHGIPGHGECFSVDPA